MQPAEVGVTARWPQETGTDADILTTPETHGRSQMNFDSANVGFELQDFPQTILPVTLQPSCQALVVGHSDIWYCSDRRKPRHRHYQNSTVSAKQHLDCLDLGLLAVRIEQEGRRHIVADRWIGKTSWRYRRPAENRFNSEDFE